MNAPINATVPTYDADRIPAQAPFGMISIKVAEANRLQLDWLIANCLGLPVKRDPMAFGFSSGNGGYWVWGDSIGAPKGAMSRIGAEFSPTASPAQMLPIMDKAEIDTYCVVSAKAGGGEQEWAAEITGLKPMPRGRGRTRLIAAARCWIVSVRGEIVEVPADLA